MPDSDLHRVLVYGAGVIGSLYAARIWQAGLNTSILARGSRLKDLREHGIVLQDCGTGGITTAPVTPVASLPSMQTTIW
jgi:2-dehydropantoate 2-reductase